MNGFRVGLGNQILNSRFSPTALARADYLTAMPTGLDAYWVGDHLNALFPRSIYTPQYMGVARVAPKVDAAPEPWTLLGHLASATGSPACALALVSPTPAAAIQLSPHRRPRRCTSSLAAAPSSASASVARRQ
jgi:hypothetical protein